MLVNRFVSLVTWESAPSPGGMGTVRLNAHGQISEHFPQPEIVTRLIFNLGTLINEVETAKSEVGVLIFNPGVLIPQAEAEKLEVRSLRLEVKALSLVVEPVDSVVRVLNFSPPVLIFNSNPVNFIIKPSGKGAVPHFESGIGISARARRSHRHPSLNHTFKMWD